MHAAVPRTRILIARGRHLSRLSIVLVAHREQGFVRHCLSSVLQQSPADVEVLVVDDASADHSAEIATEIAAADGRVHVHHLAPRQGPGPAVLAGLERATGDHVWVIEATGLLPDGAVATVLDRLVRTTGAPDPPDVLVVGHVVRDVYGVERPRPARADGRTPQLWDKVVAADHLRRLDLPSDPSRGWEVHLTWRLLAAATRVEVLDRCAYAHRDLPRAVRARSEVGAARDVVEAYADVLAWADAATRPAVLDAVAHEVPPLLRQGPSRERQAVFDALAPVWAKDRDGLADLMTLDQPRRRALDSGSYRAWLAAEQAAAAPARARRLARAGLRAARNPRRLARQARSLPTRLWYRAQLRAPIDDDLVVYAAYWYTAYSCNPRAVYEAARELEPRTRGVWVVEPDAATSLPPGVEHVVAGTRAYYRLIARARYLVNNVNFPNDIVKRPGQVHLQTHHGTPLKTMGMDLVHSPHSRKRMNFPRLMKRAARWDYSVSQNVFTSEQWERVYPSGTYRSIETGYPRNDVLATATPNDVARTRAALGLRPEQTSVLYLPTHREYHPGYVPQLDPARLADALGEDYVLLMRTHYFYRDQAAVDSTRPGRVLDVTAHPRIEDLYLAADVLVTDYSSAMFDYAVLDRPVVIYAPDWDDYRTLRGTTFDLMAEPPGAVATTEAQLTEVLTTRAAWDDASAARRHAFRERFCSLEDGGASERVVRTLWPAPSGGQR